MITALLKETCNNIEQAKHLKKAQSEIKDIEATSNELEKLLTSTRQLALTTTTCGERLGTAIIASVLAQLPPITQEVQNSKQRFNSSNRRETLALYNVGRKVQATYTDLSERWKLYAQDQLAPYLELLRLVMYLPEVAANQTKIQELTASIKQHAEKPPQNKAQLAQFDERLRQLGEYLDSIAHLPKEVQSFLGKVVEGTATLADLNSTILQWIQDSNRSSSFSISFITRRS
mgnify:FL=1|jgi:DNA repair ATPase RecN